MVFRLDQLDPTLLEKVITKFEEDSYFRLQQTCRWMDEFIQRSRNISVSVDTSCQLDHYTDGLFCRFYLGSYSRKVSYCDGSRRHPMARLDCLYGTRLRALKLPDDSLGDLDNLEYYCAWLKENRTTADYTKAPWGSTKEQCVTLLKTLKPVEIGMNSKGSNRYEALFQSKTLKSVTVELDPEDVAIALPKLLPTVSNFIITVKSIPNMFYFLRMLLKNLTSVPLPNLRDFSCHAFFTSKYWPSTEEIKKELDDFNVTVEETIGGWFTAWVDVQQGVPGGPACSAAINLKNYTYAEIWCKRE